MNNDAKNGFRVESPSNYYRKINKMDQELKEQVHFLQNILDAIPNPIFYKDKEGIYKGCNSAFEKYIGLAKSELIGKSVFEISPAELAAKYYNMDKELLDRRGTQVYESQVKYSDGSIHNVIFNKATFNNTANEVNGLVGVVVDITELRQTDLALKRSTEKLNLVLNQTVQTISTITEMRDVYTAGHQQRVSELSAAIAKEMSFSDESIHAIKVAALLHDVGKISIPAEILTKPSKLSFHEFAIVKEHSQTGYEILKSIDFPFPVAEIVRQHHERLDGSGYPRGLKGCEIMIEACVIAVADVVEAISSHRPYRPSLGIENAIDEITNYKGIRYNTNVVDACLRLFKKGYSFSQNLP